MLKVLGDLRPHKRFCLLRILNITRAQFTAARRMGVEVHGAGEDFALHRVHRLRLHGDRDFWSVIAQVACTVVDEVRGELRRILVALREEAAGKLQRLDEGPWNRCVTVYGRVNGWLESGRDQDGGDAQPQAVENEWLKKWFVRAPRNVVR